jgi:hypothetical protein
MLQKYKVTLFPQAKLHFNTPPKMSNMPATGGHSKPCCNVPPIVSKGYKNKGTFEEIGGYKTCEFCHLIR